MRIYGNPRANNIQYSTLPIVTFSFFTICDLVVTFEGRESCVTRRRSARSRLCLTSLSFVEKAAFDDEDREDVVLADLLRVDLYSIMFEDLQANQLIFLF